MRPNRLRFLRGERLGPADRRRRGASLRGRAGPARSHLAGAGDLGIIPAARFGLSDEDAVSGLADQVTGALRNAVDGREADPRPLAVGLLGVLGQSAHRI